MSNEYNNVLLDEIYNNYTINIFSDASISKTFGSYGSIAVNRDTELEKSLFVKENTTVNECELLGIRLSLLLAHKYQYRYKVINIFSDSKISIDVITGFMNHTYKQINDNGQIKYLICRIVKPGNKEVPYKNQELLADCIWLYYELLKNPNIVINLLHQSGHIIPNRFDNYKDIKSNNIKYAQESFINNNIYYNRIISEEFIMYISKYNDNIDRSTRIALQEMLYRSNKQYYTTPIHFKPLCCSIPSLLERKRR